METLKDGTIVRQAQYKHGDQEGWYVRGFNENRKEYLMLDSYFDPDLPRWIKDVKTPLVVGKGIPTSLYLDLYLLKKLGVTPEELKTITIHQVHEWDSVFHLTQLSQKYPNENLGELFKRTRLFRARNNVLKQTGLKITGIEIDPKGSIFSHPHHLVNKKESVDKDEIKMLGRKYGIKDGETVYWNFNIIISVEPF
jgi:hypothetical protein